MMNNHPDIGGLDGFCQLLKVTGNPNRLRILSELLAGERSVGEIEEILKIRQPGLSHELKKLRETGFVTTRRQSKVVFYVLADAEISSFVQSIQRLHLSLSDKSAAPLFDIMHRYGRTACGAIKHPSVATSPKGECGQFSIVS